MDNLFPVVGKAPKMKHVQAIAFHDHDGRIHHMHHVIVLEGACSMKYKTMEREAFEQAAELGVDISQLEILHISNIKNPNVMHRVDIKRQILVEVEVPKPCLNSSKKK